MNSDNLGNSETVGKLFSPTITDLKLLIGTKEWIAIKQEMNIDENTPDEEALDEDEEDDVDVVRPDHFDEDSDSVSGAGSHSKKFGIMSRE